MVSQYRGRPIFLNLWATWCAPCRKELGDIAALRDSLAARARASKAVSEHADANDVVILLIAPEPRKRVEKFARTVPWDLPFVVEVDHLPPVLGMRAVPTTWLIDREGRLVHTQRGAAPWGHTRFVQLVVDALF